MRYRTFSVATLFGLLSTFSLFSYTNTPAWLPPVEVYGAVEAGYLWVGIPKFTYGNQSTSFFGGSTAYISQLTVDDQMRAPFARLKGGVRLYPTSGIWRSFDLEGFGFIGASEIKTRSFAFSNTLVHSQ